MGGSLRDRLRARQRPSVPCRLQVDDTAAAQRAAEEAVVALRLAQARGAAPEEVTAAREAVTAAQAALEACYATVTVTALPPGDLEALVAAHPPREGSDDREWNTDTFPRALLLECLPGDMTGEEWAEFLATSCSDGEVAALEQAALAVNVRAPDGTLPKGWIETIS
ncbi:hypothetical protein HNP84_000230 [Thermocatellispora tengchongensis]|uniref:Uncharacterized protein n=1 Tax=Thermocatellispora tengchongensis TaxID=1073253 RepID=A0A840NTG0_9ACTN|nr:hypothetical protein [Thermocatellispora tengchongensis]MBB5130542.1 hypothetical protein [Thermocatellispora tengchongensis]